MTEIRGIHTELVLEMASALDGAGEAATDVLKPLQDDVNEAMSLGVFSALFLGVQPVLALQQVAESAGPRAAEIRRRREHLLACRALEQDGIEIDPGLWFADNPPPSRADIEQAAATARRVLDGGDDADITEFERLFADLTDAERDALLGSQLDSEQRESLGPLFTDRWNDDDGHGDTSTLETRLDILRGLEVQPSDFDTLLENYWTSVAADSAGIDLAAWDPSEGVDGNRQIIEDVYRYYGDLYLENPSMQWAGMANMIGPSFAAGFLDLDMIGDVADNALGPLNDLPGPARTAVYAVLPPGFQDVAALADLTESDLDFYETTLLSMQREIFEDQASMHEAYLDGGMDAINEMREAGIIDSATEIAWEDIDTGRRTGDDEALARGNEHLLYREQHDIIADDYEEMRNHFPTGPAMTYMMGAIGQPSVPGAQTLGEVSGASVSVTTPGPDRVTTPESVFGVDIPTLDVDNPTRLTTSVETNWPNGNIADFDTRWSLIAEDTLPAYQELLREDPERARELIDTDPGERIDEYRLSARWNDILGTLASIKVDVDQ